MFHDEEILNPSFGFNKLATRDEVSYYIVCNESDKYSIIFPGLKIMEGSEYLLYKNMFCHNLQKISGCLNHLMYKVGNEDYKC
ncbi:MAG: hypothetical protein J7L82_04805 [Staphylothermus sp.]|nr:hypothetical protein [Staphylothermus sp.]